ncbi:SpoIIE family protein phosphatase [Streptomyces sp. NPDC001276]|uniref:SpoIIE family protein phosphatase n=1 Tax=Streptomyces sp. NPDC001276 TaxID=3364555 RepID=UPI0036A43E58
MTTRTSIPTSTSSTRHSVAGSIRSRRSRPTSRACRLNPGETLFFLTDGVIVSPTEGLDPGLARLATSLSEAQTAADPALPSLEDLIDVPLKALGDLRHDDAVLLAARLS